MIEGQVEQPLPDGRRLVSAMRVVEDGARAVLLLAPGLFRVDATPGVDMFRITVRPLEPAIAVRSESAGRPAARLLSSGVDVLDLPLVGAAALTVHAGEVVHRIQVGTLRDAARATTTLTVQAVAESSTPAR